MGNELKAEQESRGHSRAFKLVLIVGAMTAWGLWLVNVLVDATPIGDPSLREDGTVRAGYLTH